MRKKNEGLTVGEMGAEIGRRFVHPFGGLNVEVMIYDVKFAYGTKRWQVGVSNQESNRVWIFAPERVAFTDGAAGYGRAARI